VNALAAAGIHIHLYGNKVRHQFRDWVERARHVAPRHVHLHPHADQRSWLAEFSRYDAGWLADFASHNQGDIVAATWDDLNYPARQSTLALAGVPSIQRDNGASTVAVQTLARRRGLGIQWRDTEELIATLHDRDRMASLSDGVWAQRDDFTFDAHVDGLIEYFRALIAA
jgi:hypothetical protein